VVSDAGFTKVPNRLVRDVSLSLAARGLHAVLLDLAWQETGVVEDVYEIRFELTEEEIAVAAGCSVDAFRNRADELGRAGFVTRTRTSRRATVVWTIRRSPSPTETPGLSPPETTGLSPTETRSPRARSSSRSKNYDQKNDDFVVDDGGLIEVTDEDGEPVEAVIEADALDTLIADFPATSNQRSEFEAAYRENPNGFAREAYNARNGRTPVAVLTAAVRAGAHRNPDGGRHGLTPAEIRRLGNEKTRSAQ
jgi:hypothetical protein